MSHGSHHDSVSDLGHVKVSDVHVLQSRLDDVREVIESGDLIQAYEEAKSIVSYSYHLMRLCTDDALTLDLEEVVHRLLRETLGVGSLTEYEQEVEAHTNVEMVEDFEFEEIA